MKTKDKIINSSIELFNRSGISAVTTNHIAKELKISPGNLYFHYENKEEILRDIFVLMCNENYKIWSVSKKNKAKDPIDCIEQAFEVFWRYRFFHREMYYVRRRDVLLNKMWKAHIDKIVKMMTLTYRRWIKMGWVRKIDSEKETDFIVSVLLATASTFFHFFESAERQPLKKNVEVGKKYIARLLFPYTEGSTRDTFQHYIDN